MVHVGPSLVDTARVELLSTTTGTFPRFSRPYTILSPPIATARRRRSKRVCKRLFGLKFASAAPAGFWEREVARRENPSVHSSAAIQALLSPRALAALDRALRYERMIYDAAVVVHDRRCRAHLGSEACAA